jgi:hypothetical protein
LKLPNRERGLLPEDEITQLSKDVFLTDSTGMLPSTTLQFFIHWESHALQRVPSLAIKPNREDMMWIQ